jgi:hypothetical protein
MMLFRIGADARCTDGSCGQVSRIIVNPVTRKVTLISQSTPSTGLGPARLVPVDLVDAATGHIQLRCTLAEFQALRPAQETEIVRDLDPTGHDNAPKQVIGWGRRRSDRASFGASKAPRQVTVDYIPPDELDIRRDLTVCATDDEIGQVGG